MQHAIHMKAGTNHEVRATRLPSDGVLNKIKCFSYVCSVCACLDLSVSSSSWGLGRAAVCNCGTPWTFLLPFLNKIKITLHSELCLKNTQKWFNEHSSRDSCNIRLHIYRMWISAFRIGIKARTSSDDT